MRQCLQAWQKSIKRQTGGLTNQPGLEILVQQHIVAEQLEAALVCGYSMLHCQQRVDNHILHIIHISTSSGSQEILYRASLLFVHVAIEQSSFHTSLKQLLNSARIGNGLSIAERPQRKRSTIQGSRSRTRP